MGLVLFSNKKLLSILLLLLVIVFSLVFSQVFSRTSIDNMQEGLTGKQTNDIMNKIVFDSNSSSIQKLNSIRSIVSMTDTADASNYNAILFDTTLSDDLKITKIQKLVDSTTTSSSN